MYRIITDFFIYLLKSLPVAAFVAGVLLFFVPKSEILDDQMFMFSKKGLHVLEIDKGFTRVTLGANGEIYVLDRLYCNKHKKLEIFVRPVGYWSLDNALIVSPDKNPEELLE